MAKTGRNQPCPCGSGLKYKRCCLAGEERARRVQGAAAIPLSTPSVGPEGSWVELEFDRLSNRVVDLIDARQFDAATTACDELQAHYPDEIDWLMRRAMLHEALGQTTRAIEFYQRTVAFMEDNPEGFDVDSREPWQASLDELQRTLVQSS